jgi:hypothetical protein
MADLVAARLARFGLPAAVAVLSGINFEFVSFNHQLPDGFNF